jgi:hypothetical protein
MKKYALEGDLVEQIKYSLDNELVSTDIVGSAQPSIFDSKATIVSEDGKNAVLYVWYDNEYGYSQQVIRLAKYIAKGAKVYLLLNPTSLILKRLPAQAASFFGFFLTAGNGSKSQICKKQAGMADSKKKPIFRRKRYIIPLVILALIIIGRIMLPYFLKNYVNKTLNEIPGYMGHVEDIDVALYRGAYVIKGLKLRKMSAKTDTPMLDFPKSDISIEWKSLFKGKIVSEVILHGPKFNYIFEDQKAEPVEGEPDVDDWTKALTDLVPIDINHFNVHNGTANFVRLAEDPDINMFLENIDLDATNLSNVVDKDRNPPVKPVCQSRFYRRR